MKVSIIFILVVTVAFTASAQYYYKDIVAFQEANQKEKLYSDDKVKSVELTSQDAEGQPEAGFQCNQKTSNDYLEIDTYSKSKFTPESFQISIYGQSGLLIKSIDTSKTFYSVTVYQLDGAGRITDIVNTATETDNQLNDIEEHQWKYDANGKPAQMIKIKNRHDTTDVRFVLDDKGRVAEEHALHEGLPLQTIYYYFDTSDHLTDIVRFNEAAHRLLPDFIFTYNTTGSLASMIVVPEGSTDYQRWVYQYNEQKLRVSETCYNKQHLVLGKVLYQYNFGK